MMTKPEGASVFETSTLLCALGRNPEEQFGFLNAPLYKGSTVIHKTLNSLENNGGRFFYGIAGSPTIAHLEDSWTSLTGAAGTVVTPSGHNAIAVAIMSLVKTGCHILLPESVFEPTTDFCNGILLKFSVEVEYYDPLIGKRIECMIKPNTALIFMESPGSHTMEVQDIPAIVKIAQKHDVRTVVDNTWATPLFFKPHSHGVDISIEAGTKYVGGHSDLLIGLISANQESWPLLKSTYRCFGPLPAGEDCQLAIRGLRTFELRVKEAQRRALKMAKWLKTRDEVEKVLHPALEDCPGHEYWVRDFAGSTGVFTIVLKDVYMRAGLVEMLENMQVFGLGYSWGGYESLIIPVSKNARERLKRSKLCGFSLRLQIGLEGMEDLKRDLELGFERLQCES